METSFPTMPVTVSAAVRRGQSVLFVRDAYGDFQGLWTFPAGFVDAGEQPEAAAIREAREETGVECVIEGLMSVGMLRWRERPMLYLVFLARYVAGEPTPDGRETEAAAFWGIEALEQPSFDRQNAFLARRILTDEVTMLSPYQDPAWHAMYRTTFA